MPKYESRFENFFANLRMSRAQFGSMAEFTLQALRQAAPAGRYQALAEPLAQALADYAATHAGQLSGAGKQATATVAEALEAFREYVKRVERKHAAPAYDPGSPDLLALFPRGRAALTDSTRATVLPGFTAFLDALDERQTVFAASVRTEGRALLDTLRAALQAANGHHQTASTLADDLADDRRAICTALLRAYASLLLEHADDPGRVAAYFDFSAAHTGSKAARKVAKAK